MGKCYANKSLTGSHSWGTWCLELLLCCLSSVLSQPSVGFASHIIVGRGQKKGEELVLGKDLLPIS